MSETKAAQTREAILRAALTEFSMRGYDGVTNREVAARAGVSHGLIRYHFATKESMWREGLKYLFSCRDAVMSKALDESKNDIDKFRTFIRDYVVYCARFPEHIRIIMLESVSYSSRFDWIYDNYTRDGYAGLVPLLERLVASGNLPNQPIASLHFALSAACQNIFALGHQYERLVGEDPCGPDVVQRHADAVIDLFLRNAAPA